MSKKNPRVLEVGIEGATEIMTVAFGVPITNVEDVTKVIKDHEEAEAQHIAETKALIE